METTKIKKATSSRCRVVSAKVKLSGNPAKPKSEVMSVEDFERRLEDGNI